jgi:FkbM family methyltransferase
MFDFKKFGKRLVNRTGLDIRRLQPPASHLRPIGEQASVLADLKARGFTPAVIFDIGAATGSWTAETAPIFPRAKFITVEPRATGLEPTVRAAVGAAEGTAVMTDWKTGSTLLPTTDTDSPKYSVPVTTLDRLAAQFGMPDLVKLDVEGFELEALKGADTLWGRTEVFVIEVSLYRFSGRPMLHEIVPFMADHAYFVYDVAGFIRRPYDGAVAMMDLCFSRTLRGSETEWFAIR